MHELVCAKPPCDIMKKALVAIFSLILGVWCFSQAAPRLVDRYYQEFDTNDGTNLLEVYARVEREVPIADRRELFAALIDKAAEAPQHSRIIVNVAAGLNHKASQFEWGSHLERSLLSQLKHDKPAVRAIVVALVAEKMWEKHKEVCKPLLDDPNEYVRSEVVNGIGSSKKGREVLEKYVHDQEDAVDHAESVRLAKVYLRASS